MTTTGSGFRATSAGNGAATSFAVPFAFEANAHLAVALLASADAATDSVPAKVLGVDYTISGSGPAGAASVNFFVPPPAGTFVRRERRTPREQRLDLVPGVPVPGPSLEQALDRLAMCLEEVEGRVDALTGTAGFVAAVRAVVAAQLQTGMGIDITALPDGRLAIGSLAGTGTAGGITAEDVRDVIGTALVASTGVGIVVDDAANTITLTATGAYSDELARDAIGTALVAGAGVQLTIDDAGDHITIALDPVQVFEIPLPAAALRARATSGAVPATFETATHRINYACLDFDPVTPQYAQGRLRMPKSWNAATSIGMRAIWTAAGGTPGQAVRWGFRATAMSDGDGIDSPMGATITVEDVFQGTGGLHQSALSTGIVPGNSPAQADVVVFEVFRDAAHANDNLAANARLLDLVLRITTLARDDS